MAMLRLRFTGLCAFVPNMAGNEARVIMVDATKPHSRNDKSHSAVLLVPTARVVTGADWRKPDVEFYDPDGIQMALFYLSDHDVKIADAKPAKLEIDHPGSLSGCPNPDGTDEKYFSWVGSMSLINVGSGDIHPDCLKPFEVSAALGARVFLSEGLLTNFDFARASDRRIVRWGFKPVSGGNPAAQEQALSEEVQLKVGLANPYVDFLFVKGIHGKAPQSGPTLRVVADDVTVVWIVNMPIDDIKNRKYRGALLASREALPLAASSEKEFGKEAVPSDRDIDYHFVHYYHLLAGGVSNRVPHPIDRCPTDTGPSVANPKCPPVQLNAAG